MNPTKHRKEGGTGKRSRERPAKWETQNMTEVHPNISSTITVNGSYSYIKDSDFSDWIINKIQL